MFPLRDENPTRTTPFVTVGLILANVAVWFLVEGAGAREPYLQAICEWGAIPGELTGALSPGEVVRRPGFSCPIGGHRWSTVVSSTFLHGGWMHLILNMWFLWVFGNNVEDWMGHLPFTLFYLATGVLAGLAHVVSAPESAIPTVGASGAISGVMGAYVILFPRVRVYTLLIIVFFVRVISLPAWVMLGYWMLLQLLSGLSGAGASGGVAVWAHIGGFVAGVAFLLLLRPLRLLRRRR